MDMAVQWALAQQAKGRDVFCHCTHVSGVPVSCCTAQLPLGCHLTPLPPLPPVPCRCRRCCRTAPAILQCYQIL